ncbi:M48 family metallopeptidase [Fimbriimonadia bacterium ATM]|nr:MAG: M48 family peptidase [Armatimonadota bacterium]MBC6970280.1 M48 family peptidase [Armatimonadota bacterium]MCE7899540.1 M48 family peptidase [Armatimonadetes bacterium ATM1]MDL1927628.1 M48 family metallopeptidase [Fimbriimonadia bacterium ATM]RIJ96444.1 MAG: metal-dependent hydrolase [Armatimonadota bacterium]
MHEVRPPLEEIVPKAIFRSEVAAWANRIGVEFREIHIRPMRNKWASCSTNGRLSFDIALLSQPARVRTETIVHELLHLKVPNHGKLFKALLRGHLRRGSPYSGSDWSP